MHAPAPQPRRRPPAPLITLLLVTCAASPARADDRPGHEPLSLPAGALRSGSSLEVSLDIRAHGEPSSLAPDLHLGVTDRLSLGLIHSGRALGLLDSGWGFCLTGPSGGCDRVYSGTGLDGWYTFWKHRVFELAVRTRFYAARFSDPLKLRVTGGLLGVLRLGPVALRFDPHVSVGLTHRDRGNADTLNVPLHLFVALGRRVSIYLRTGLRGLLPSFADQYYVPVGLGVLVRPLAQLRLGAQFAFRQLLGPLNTHKKCDLLFYADFRFPSLL